MAILQAALLCGAACGGLVFVAQVFLGGRFGDIQLRDCLVDFFGLCLAAPFPLGGGYFKLPPVRFFTAVFSLSAY